MLARASEYLPETMVLGQSGHSPGKPQCLSPELVWPHFLPWVHIGNQEWPTCISLELPKYPILQRNKLRLSGTKGPA